jgi:hypothetical protein
MTKAITSTWRMIQDGRRAKRQLTRRRLRPPRVPVAIRLALLAPQRLAVSGRS